MAAADVNPQCLCDGQCSRILRNSEPSENSYVSSDPADIDFTQTFPRCICPTCGEEGNPDNLSRRCPECSMLGMPLPPNNYTHIGAVNTTGHAMVSNDNEQESAPSDPEGRDHVAMTFQEYGCTPYRIAGQKAAVKRPAKQHSSRKTSDEFLPKEIKPLLLCQSAEMLHCGLSIPTKIQEYGA